MKVVTPGQDTAYHDSTLQQGIAESLNGLRDQNMGQFITQPPQTQSPVNSDLSQMLEKPGFEMDLEDFLSGETGRPRNEPPRNFLKILLGKLKKQQKEE